MSYKFFKGEKYKWLDNKDHLSIIKMQFFKYYDFFNFEDEKLFK